MSLPSPNMPTAEDEDETDVNTEVSANITRISIKNFKTKGFFNLLELITCLKLKI